MSLKDKIFIDNSFGNRIKESYIHNNFNDYYNDINDFCIKYNFKEFKWKRKVYHYIFNITEVPKCYCGNCIKFRGRPYKIYNKFCSNKCSTIYTSDKRMDTLKKSNNDKYGVDNVFQLESVKKKIKETNLDKYGYENPNGNMYIRKKIENTNLEKYGYKSPLSNTKIRKKIESTCIERYNSTSPFGSELIKDKIRKTVNDKYGGFGMASKELSEKHKKTCVKKYGTCNYFSSEKFMSENNYQYTKSKEYDKIISDRYINKLDVKYLSYTGGIFTIKCDVCGEYYEIYTSLLDNRLKNNVNLCTICTPKNSLTSIKENEVLNYIKSIYDGKIVVGNRKILDGKEIDIYLPDLKLAFEFNGDYWHSDIFKESDYHLNKLLLCYDKGVKLIHIWEHDFMNDIECVYSNIKYNIENHDKFRIIDGIGDEFGIYETNQFKVFKLPKIKYMSI